MAKIQRDYTNGGLLEHPTSSESYSESHTSEVQPTWKGKQSKRSRKQKKTKVSFPKNYPYPRYFITGEEEEGKRRDLTELELLSTILVSKPKSEVLKSGET